jgi:hypothetical protein
MMHRNNRNREQPLIRTNTPWIIDVVSSFEKVKTFNDDTAPIDVFLGVLNAKTRLDELFINSIYAQHLRVSSQHAVSFKEALEKASGEMSGNIVSLPVGQMVTLRYQATQFLTVLTSELGVIPTFMVSVKEGFDVGQLTDSGYRLFPPSTLAKVPETEKDMAEAGKALAFELSTACGFHTFRVLESVLKRYWDHVSQKKRPRLETIGNYAKELAAGPYGEQKVWEALRQIGDLHRNPLIHPDAILSVEEAIGTLGIVRSVIGAMLSVMPDVPTSTAISVTP